VYFGKRTKTMNQLNNKNIAKHEANYLISQFNAVM